MLRRCWPAVIAGLVATSLLGAAELNRPAGAGLPGAQPIRMSHCLISLIDDAEVPAEKAGVLVTIAVREGDNLVKGALIATIDERQAQHQLDAARSEHEAAAAKADSALEVEYAVATHRTAEAEYKIALSANQKQPNAVSVVEVEKLRLAAEQARIKILVTEFDRRVREIEAAGFAAKARLSETDLAQRRLTAPLDGEVVEVFFGPGEWVEPGRPVIRLVRLDRLRVEGFVQFAEQSPAKLLHRPVRATVAFAGGEIKTFEGRVTFVSPMVQPGGEYRVWAEVDNRRDGDDWQLRPGLEADLEIGVNR